MNDATFSLIGRPTVIFQVVKRYDAAGFIPSVVGVTLDGTKQTVAREADVIGRDEDVFGELPDYDPDAHQTPLRTR